MERRQFQVVEGRHRPAVAPIGVAILPERAQPRGGPVGQFIESSDMRPSCIENKLRGSKGKVIHQARERAREFLRARQDFVWNATNQSREIRGQLVNLFTDYHARVRIIYVEASVSKLHRQNKDRAEAVPGAAISRMMDRWEIPTAIEADAVEWWVDGEQPATYPHAAQ